MKVGHIRIPTKKRKNFPNLTHDHITLKMKLHSFDDTANQSRMDRYCQRSLALSMKIVHPDGFVIFLMESLEVKKNLKGQLEA